jgi:hypothetical protein
VKLVWCQEFPTRYEALAAERQIKGWRKEKKLALIRGDWDLISHLSKVKERPSTSSGRTALRGTASSPSRVRPEPVEGRHLLLKHPAHDGDAVWNMTVSLSPGECELRLRFTVLGEISRLLVPRLQTSQRTDELWRHTCFEAFVRHRDGSYWEFNLSPSSRWAAYAFSSYRQGMRPLELTAPDVTAKVGREQLRLEATLPLACGSLDQVRLNLAAVIEEKSGQKSYWALAHPLEGPPDFHHPSCFVLELPPPSAP